MTGNQTRTEGDITGLSSIGQTDQSKYDRLGCEDYMMIMFL